LQGGQSRQGLFIKRCIEEYACKNVTQALLLLKVGVGSQWFTPLLAYPHCWLDERQAYVRGTSGAAHAELFPPSTTRAAPHGSVLVYLGPKRIAKRFALMVVEKNMGRVPGLNAWAHPQEL
jgi:hypothetical protein